MIRIKLLQNEHVEFCGRPSLHEERSAVRDDNIGISDREKIGE
jgi:hypothetical protein